MPKISDSEEVNALTRFYPVTFRMQPGDEITCKKGILIKDPIVDTDQFYLVKKFKVIGFGKNGATIEAIIKKPIDVVPVDLSSSKNTPPDNGGSE